MPKNKSGHGKSQVRESIALARAFCGLPIDAGNISEPFANVLRAVIGASGDKVAAYHDAAQADNLDDADALLKSARAVDPNATPEVEKPIEIIMADDILTTRFPDPVWAVPNLLPRGLTILAGAPKLGKSWLALQIALSVASGGMTFKERVTPGAVYNRHSKARPGDCKRGCDAVGSGGRNRPANKT